MSTIDENNFLVPIEATIIIEPKVEEPEVPVQVQNVVEEPEVPVQVQNVVEEPEVPVQVQNVVEEPEVSVQVQNVVEENTTEFEEVIVKVELNTLEESLTTIILNIIKTYDEKKEEAINYFNKIGIQESKDIIDLTQKIIDSNPSVLNNIENIFIEITKDNKIDTSDIPHFILILQILYERIFTQKDFSSNPIKRSEFSANILKFIIHVLVEERKIIQDKNKNDFLIQIDKLIDSCVSLLNFSHILETPKVCCSVM